MGGKGREGMVQSIYHLTLVAGALDHEQSPVTGCYVHHLREQWAEGLARRWVRWDGRSRYLQELLAMAVAMGSARGNARRRATLRATRGEGQREGQRTHAHHFREFLIDVSTSFGSFGLYTN